MSLRPLAIAQVLFGVLLLGIGVVIAATSTTTIYGLTDDLSQGIRGFAIQIDITSKTLQDDQLLLDRLHDTVSSYEELLEVVNASSEEFGKHTEEWVQMGKDIDKLGSSTGAVFKHVASSFDFPLPCGVSPTWGTWMRMSYPNGIVVKTSDSLQLKAREVVAMGDEVTRAGKTAGATIQSAAGEYEKVHKSFATALDSSARMLGGTKQVIQTIKQRQLPELVGQLDRSSKALSNVASKTDILGSAAVGSGWLAGVAGLICILNGLTLIALDKKLYPLPISREQQLLS